MNIAMTAFRAFNGAASFVSPQWSAKFALDLFIHPRKFEPKNWELEAEQAGQRILIDERLSALRWSAPQGTEKRRKALLVHGWEGRATQMGALALGLQQEGYDVLAVDLPAHGRSPGKRSHIVEFAQALLAAQAQEGVFDLVVAHSMGAPATAVALNRGLKAERVVMISAPSQVAKVLPRFAKAIGLNSKAANLFKTMMGDFVGLPAEEVDTRLLMGDFHKPVLIIHDRNDKEIPFEASEYAASAVPQAQLYETSGLGHKRILHSKDVIRRVQEFAGATVETKHQDLCGAA